MWIEWSLIRLCLPTQWLQSYHMFLTLGLKYNFTSQILQYCFLSPIHVPEPGEKLQTWKDNIDEFSLGGCRQKDAKSSIVHCFVLEAAYIDTSSVLWARVFSGKVYKSGEFESPFGRQNSNTESGSSKFNTGDPVKHIWGSLGVYLVRSEVVISHSVSLRYSWVKKRNKNYSTGAAITILDVINHRQQ